jgi:integrase
MLSQVVQHYIDVRRACGFGFHGQAGFLHSFASFAGARNEHHVRSSTAIEWAGLARQTTQRTRRLWIVIRFARYARCDDPRHEIPPPVFGSESWPRPVPYILTQDEIARLLREAIRLGRHPLQGATYSTLFGLLACTGLRISEAIRLRYSDITPDGLLIRNTKFRKSRLVVLHSSARAALERYLRQRQAFAPLNDHVFVSVNAAPLCHEVVDGVFRTLAQRLGLPHWPSSPRATPHSLRHTFAVRALQRCPDGREQITRHMLALSTHLGHVNVAATYWYLQATPELMQDIAHCCERYLEDRS